jgi:hypothetical protein
VNLRALRGLKILLPQNLTQNSASTTRPAINLLKLTLPCRGNRAPATISRLSLEVLRLCKEIDCFYDGDKRQLSSVRLSSFKELRGGKEGKHDQSAELRFFPASALTGADRMLSAAC